MFIYSASSLNFQQIFVSLISIRKTFQENRKCSWYEVLKNLITLGQLALNPGLNFTPVSLSCVEKHFLG